MLKLTMNARTRIEDGSKCIWRARFEAHHESGKVYAIEIDQYVTGRFGRYELECQIWCNGRTLPERHRADIRQTALAMYEETYGFERVLVLGSGLQWRKASKPSRFAPSAGQAAAMAADFNTYRGV